MNRSLTATLWLITLAILLMAIFMATLHQELFLGETGEVKISALIERVETGEVALSREQLVLFLKDTHKLEQDRAAYDVSIERVFHDLNELLFLLGVIQFLVLVVHSWRGWRGRQSDKNTI